MTQTSGEGTPWDRLNKTATLASSRREIFHHDPQVVNYIGYLLTLHASQTH